MRNIRSMCRDIDWWEVNEVQIPGNKIEPQWPFLDTLAVAKPLGVTSDVGIKTSFASERKTPVLVFVRLWTRLMLSGYLVNNSP